MDHINSSMGTDNSPDSSIIKMGCLRERANSGIRRVNYSAQLEFKTEPE